MPEHHIYFCVGEPSGDQLGARLMHDLHQLTPVKFSGLGGPQMIGQGLDPLFDMSELSVMGLTEVLGKLPKLFALIDQTADDIIAKNPDCVLYIDAQDFTKRVARKVRLAAPHIRQVLYVAPTVWAWRPGRAKKLKKHIDHIMAILPFEPEVMRQLGGPPTTYVGHPLLATLGKSTTGSSGGNNLLFLPGSRGGELKRHLPIFAQINKRLGEGKRDWHITLPTLPRLKDRLRAQTNDWPIQPNIIITDTEKAKAFRTADAALAVSGTITLELACAHIPQIVIYKSDWLLTAMAMFIKKDRISLPNIILAANDIPEYINKYIEIDVISNQLSEITNDTQQRQNQRLAYQKIANKMRLANISGSSSIAAKTLLLLLK